MQTAADALPARVITVSELNRMAKAIVERGLPLSWVAGEVSNFICATSGHCYFSLKDAQAQVRCVMFRHKLQLHDWQPHNGMQIEVRAYPSLYEQRGEFQLNVETMRRSGLGALYEAFEKLKATLQAEGLFDATLKRPLPRFPRTVGVVTSLQAAALRDVLTTLKRRMPSIAVIIYPTMVQGDGAARQIVQAITEAARRAECDVLIMCRGGGSIEDLWAFNDEAVARAVRACTVPVVSGVGHETDFTIADFVADARAPTPTAAAEMVSAARADLYQELRHLRERLGRVAERVLERRMQQLDLLARRLTHPGERIANRLTHLNHLANRLRGGWMYAADGWQWRLRELYGQLTGRCPDIARLAARRQMLAQRLTSVAGHRVEVLGGTLKGLAAQLAQLNPQAVLERGYSIVRNEDGIIVRSSAQLSVGRDLDIKLAIGRAQAKVTSCN